MFINHLSYLLKSRLGGVLPSKTDICEKFEIAVQRGNSPECVKPGLNPYEETKLDTRLLALEGTMWGQWSPCTLNSMHNFREQT